jgi:nicotinate-nucleotide pyrophosphorylase (carboxylating)
MKLNHALSNEVMAYLSEDIGSGDLTAAIISEDSIAEAVVITRDNMVLCGKPWFDAIFEQLDNQIHISWLIEEGDYVEAGTELCQLTGNTRALLTGERTALNLLQTLSATATVARKYAQSVAGTGCKILDTRKTIPGLRMAQKYAVECGGCYTTGLVYLTLF